MEPNTTPTAQPAASAVVATLPSTPTLGSVPAVVPAELTYRVEDSAVVEAPKESEPSQPVLANLPVATEPKTKATKQAAKTTTPTLAIALAVLVCVVLSGLAYFAYTKNT